MNERRRLWLSSLLSLSSFTFHCGSTREEEGGQERDLPSSTLPPSRYYALHSLEERGGSALCQLTNSLWSLRRMGESVRWRIKAQALPIRIPGKLFPARSIGECLPFPLFLFLPLWCRPPLPPLGRKPFPPWKNEYEMRPRAPPRNEDTIDPLRWIAAEERRRNERAGEE